MSDRANPKDLLGVRKAPLRLVPPALVIRTAEAMANGAAKYGPYNWRKNPVRLTVYLEAIERHLLAYRDGEEIAIDSGVHHLAHAAAGLAIIFDAEAGGNLIDDRPTPGPAAKLLAQQDKTQPPFLQAEADRGPQAPKDAFSLEQESDARQLMRHPQSGVKHLWRPDCYEVGCEKVYTDGEN